MKTRYLFKKGQYQEWHNNWVSISFGLHSPALKYCTSWYFDRRHMFHISVGIFSLFLHLPIWSKRPESCEYPKYGISYHGNAFWIYYGENKWKSFYMPWDWTWVRTSCLRKDGKWENEIPRNRKEFWKDEWKNVLWSESHPYQYKLKNGEIQKRIATIKVTEREWRMRWFQWLPYIKKIRKTIEVDFNDEVGEESGSWKGGCTGCAYDLAYNETPLQCLRRMEKERCF